MTKLNTSQITDEQFSSLESILKDAGYLGKKKDRYLLEGGGSSNSVLGLLEKVGVGEAAENGHQCLFPISIQVTRKNLSKSLENELREMLDVAVEDTAMAKIDTSSLAGIKESSENTRALINRLVPVVRCDSGVKAGEEIVLLNPDLENRPMTSVSLSAYLRAKKIKAENILNSEDVPAVFPTFNPYRPDHLYQDYMEESDCEVGYINYYIPPPWTRVPNVEPKYHGDIKDLMEHLFPIEEERERVLDWAHYAVAHRNETVLCLAGSRGTGKTIFVSQLLGALVGKKYRRVVGAEVLMEKFNSEFKEGRLIVFEEVEVTDEKRLNKFKALCNKVIKLESKGVDSYTSENFSSMAIMLNNLSHLKVMPQERRFSIPEVTETALLDIWSEKRVTSFVEEIESHDSRVVAEFGKFILNRRPSVGSQIPIRGKYYFNISKLNLHMWQEYAIGFLMGLEDDTPIPLKNVVELYRLDKGLEKGKGRFPLALSTWSEFFREYIHEAVCKIGEVVVTSEFKLISTSKGSKDKNRRHNKRYEGEQECIRPTKEFLEKFGQGPKVDISMEL